MAEDNARNEPRTAQPRKEYVTPKIADETEFEAFSLTCTTPAPDTDNKCTGFLSS